MRYLASGSPFGKKRKRFPDKPGISEIGHVIKQQNSYSKKNMKKLISCNNNHITYYIVTRIRSHLSHVW